MDSGGIQKSLDWLIVLLGNPLLIPLYVGLMTAYITFMINRAQIRIARRKATFDVIINVEKTASYMLLNRRFSELRRSGGIKHICHPDTGTLHEDRTVLIEYLNHYEVVALGIRRKLLDPAVYRKWMGGAFVRDWNAAADFVERERWRLHSNIGRWRYDATTYENFEWLACLWSKDAVRLAKRRRPSQPAFEPDVVAGPDGAASTTG
ncbi:DUF4760 domain-containing protein [Sphingomonas sp. AOB5]|uniref:DUF4760 domain-containing protein n=1 Tax=Sphingomonas sp. AOB5 TaxID=3034017 RepID=UPI0023F96EBE|nr:DUF4760 domain-containing protein [Sphingomonas sp. AOB5]MDF7776653.1 DUF4760 domain-containing protein [Sphingomonas sp. AOB5]